MVLIMKKLVLSFIAVALTGSLAFSQQFTFRVEKDLLLTTGPSFLTAGDYTAWAGVYNPSTSSLSSFVDLFSTHVDNVANSLSLDGAGLINGLSGSFLSGWTLMPNAGGPTATTYDKSLIQSSLAVGSAPIVLLTTASTPAEIGLGDWVGIVSSTELVEPLTTKILSFSATIFNYDTAVIGEFGSYQLYQVVPEPATYALLGGVFALGLVIWQRRRK